MTINLFDIPVATSAYIDNEVDVKVGRVTGNLQPGEDGTYSIRVKNAAAPNGVRLTDISLHLTVAPGSVAKLLAPGAAVLIPRASGDTSGPRLPRNEEVEEMFVFFNSDDSWTLDAGEELELELEYRAVAAGNSTISCHVHASVDVDRLFPRSGGANGSKGFTVRS